MEQREFQGISFYLIRKRGMRNLRLKVNSKGSVVVSAPYWVRITDINNFVLRCESKIKKAEKNIPKHTYLTGDSILLLGRNRFLEVIELPQKNKTMAQYCIEDGKIAVYVGNKDVEIVKNAIKQMYINTVAEVLASRVPYWVNVAQIGNVPSFGVNKAKTKWGVCYTRERRLYLSYMCAILPYELIDMVVLHEVCHLKIEGHGPAFWALMRNYMPDLDKRRAQLKEFSKQWFTYNLV